MNRNLVIFRVGLKTHPTGPEVRIEEEDVGAGIDRKLHDPVKDKLSPVFRSIFPRAKTISALVRGMANTAFTGRQLGEAVDVLEPWLAIRNVLSS